MAAAKKQEAVEAAVAEGPSQQQQQKQQRGRRKQAAQQLPGGAPLIRSSTRQRKLQPWLQRVTEKIPQAAPTDAAAAPLPPAAPVRRAASQPAGNPERATKSGRKLQEQAGPAVRRSSRSRSQPAGPAAQEPQGATSSSAAAGDDSEGDDDVPLALTMGLTGRAASPKAGGSNGVQHQRYESVPLAAAACAQVQQDESSGEGSEDDGDAELVEAAAGAPEVNEEELPEQQQQHGAQRQQQQRKRPRADDSDEDWEPPPPSPPHEVAYAGVHSILAAPAIRQMGGSAAVQRASGRSRAGYSRTRSLNALARTDSASRRGAAAQQPPARLDLQSAALAKHGQHGQYVIARVSTCGPRGRPRSLSMTGSGFSGGSYSGGEGAGAGAGNMGAGGPSKRLKASCAALGSSKPSIGVHQGLFGLCGAPSSTPCGGNEDDDGCSALSLGVSAAAAAPAAAAGSASPVLLSRTRLFGGGGGALPATSARLFDDGVSAAHSAGNPDYDQDQDQAQDDALMSDVLLVDMSAPRPAFDWPGSGLPMQVDGVDVDACDGAVMDAAGAAPAAAVFVERPASPDLQRDVARLLGDDDWASDGVGDPLKGAKRSKSGVSGTGICGMDAGCAGGGAGAAAAPGTAAADGGSESDSPTCSGAELDLLGGWELEVNRATPDPELLADLQAATGAGGGSGGTRGGVAAAVRVRGGDGGSEGGGAAESSTLSTSQLVALRSLCGSDGAGGASSGDAQAMRAQLATTLAELEAARCEVAAQRRLAADKDRQVQQVLRELMDIRQQVQALQVVSTGGAVAAAAAASAAAASAGAGAPGLVAGAGGCGLDAGVQTRSEGAAAAGRDDEDSSGEQGSEAGGAGGAKGHVSLLQAPAGSAQAVLLQGLGAAATAAAEQQQEMARLRAQNAALQQQVLDARVSGVSVASAVLQVLLASPQLTQGEKARVSAEMSQLLVRASAAVAVPAPPF